MKDLRTLYAELDKVERQLRRHAMFRKPDRPPPHIPITERFDEMSRQAAEIANRVFYIRSLPACSKMFGPVSESQVVSFLHDCQSTRDRVEFARNQLNNLISDLGLIPRIDHSAFEKVAA